MIIYLKRLKSSKFVRVKAFPMYGGIGMSAPSLHRESTNSLIYLHTVIIRKILHCIVALVTMTTMYNISLQCVHTRVICNMEVECNRDKMQKFM